MPRPKRRAVNAKNRKEEKIDLRERSSHSKDNQTNPDTEEAVNRSSSLSSAPLSAPPSPWLTEGRPSHRDENASSSQEWPKPETSSDQNNGKKPTEVLPPNDDIEIVGSRLGVASSTRVNPATRDQASGHVFLRPAAPTFVPGHRPTNPPAVQHSAALQPVAVTSLAIVPPEQQHELARRIGDYLHPFLTVAERNPIRTIRDVRLASEGYWRQLSYMDNAGPTVVHETHFAPHIQMRAAFLWARNHGMIPYHEMVQLLKLPPGCLTAWVRRWGRG
ncbi:hypothetical protein P171DRAFT_436487 [Karstenula rhodostoma CBS 690.94]|uniref:Uncharacterized protein n=1 Tax=Karstenula rhodostoma CBS 690.94 TaxID=1392251 RepID=A0A9P4U7L5_9PLEO|nr:hypothetical protein P171DRAFT_436487 [Karstenula rhodostoma CBS 690.94]